MNIGRKRGRGRKRRKRGRVYTLDNSTVESSHVIFPIHPRTRKMMEQFDLSFSENIFLLSPLGFKEALFLWKDATLVMADSGELQEETTALSVPCVTLRENTERPIIVEMGTNVLSGTSKNSILKSYRESIGKNEFSFQKKQGDGGQ
ncbi:MAG: UDP-N-acetylglucosamine 2-epimerase [Thermodesulfobacteriota bacterium]|nr:UDP-N-acetylglucosamine 2-epimerase [Thermodesulfobacteriota bacterium]